jgi:hypothetical protein
MRGSAAFRAAAAPGGVLAGPWVKNELWRRARAVPSLDLRFADNKSLVDATTGQNLVTFTRASSGTYVGSDGLIKTAVTNEPRFDHNPTTGESLGLLVEESGTNLLLQSNMFNTTWTNSNSSETATAGIAPDGTNTAWELRDTSDASAAAHSLLQSVPFTSGNAYTFTVWMKAGTLNEGGIAIPSAAFGAVLINRINLSTGAVISTSVNSTTVVTPFGDGWYRIALTATATATASGSVQIRSMNGGTTYIGTGTGTVLIWGAQLEADAFPTSYIPTTSSTVTRAADVASISGSNFSSWYRQDEGTVFADVPGIYSTAAAFTFSDGTNNNRILLDHGTNTRRCRIVTGGADQASLTSSYTYGSPIKSAAAYILDNSALANNGSLSANSPDTSCTIPTAIDRLNIGSNATSAAQAGTSIRRLTYWPQRLPNSTLQTITQ